jgi:hypothetical protein
VITDSDINAAPTRNTQALRLPPRWLLACLIGIGVFAVTAVAVWQLASSSEQKDNDAVRQTTTVGVTSRIVTLVGLRSLAHALGRPVYWAGERAGASLEYTQTSDGSVYVRYLTGRAKAGDKRASYVVVATYVQPNAFARVQSTARRQRLAIERLPNGAIAVTEPRNARNVHLVFPVQPYQIEVYAPTAEEAHEIVRSGVVMPVG